MMSIFDLIKISKFEYDYFLKNQLFTPSSWLIQKVWISWIVTL